MEQEQVQSLRNLLLQHEGYREFPYDDSTGHLTIGIGRNLSAKGISYREANVLLEDDIAYFADKLNHVIEFFPTLDANRQIALIDMAFNLGVNGLLEFHLMLNALSTGHYEAAAQEVLNSKWATQVGQRAKDIADILATGTLACLKTS